MNTTQIFSTTDPDEFHHMIAQVGRTRRVEQIGKKGFTASARCVRWPNIGLFSTDMRNARVLADEGRDFIGLTVPLRNAFQIAEAGRLSGYEPDSAHVLGYGRRFDLRTARSTRMLVANFSRPEIKRFTDRLSPDADRRKLGSGGRLSLSHPRGKVLAEFLDFVLRDTQNPAGLSASPVAQTELESTLIAAFLHAFLVEEEDEPTADWQPPWLGRAEDYIAANLDRPVTLADIAAIAGVSSRSLTRVFARKHGVGPVGLLHRLRMERIRSELLAADARHHTVTGIATNYGVGDLGRFAVSYRRVFGERPSDTLRR